MRYVNARHALSLRRVLAVDWRLSWSSDVLTTTEAEPHALASVLE
jgi:hypothetical protein